MRRSALLPLLALPVIWGIYYVATQCSVAEMSVFSVGMVIRLVTMILLTLLMLARKQLPSLLNIKGIWKRLVLIGIMGFLLDLTAFIGLSLCPAGIGTVLLKSDILFVNLISIFVYRERFTVLDWIFTFVMLCGIVLVLGIDFANTDLGGIGNIFFILSAMFVSINAFLIKSVQHNKNNPANDNLVAYYNNFVTLILFTVFSCFSGEIVQLAKIGRSSSLTLSLLIAALGQTLVYLVYYYNLRRMPVWIVKIFNLIMPLVTTLIMFMLFDEEITGMRLLGIAVVLAGAGGILVEQHRKERRF